MGSSDRNSLQMTSQTPDHHTFTQTCLHPTSTPRQKHLPLTHNHNNNKTPNNRNYDNKLNNNTTHHNNLKPLNNNNHYTCHHQLQNNDKHTNYNDNIHYRNRFNG